MDRIIEDPAIFDGVPIFRGTRVRVSDVLGALAAGADVTAVLREFPRLTEDDVRAALRRAAESLGARRVPRLSVVLIVYDMPGQAERTLLSLSPEHQRGAVAGDYEVVVVENASDRCLDERTVRSRCSNARYFRREDGTQSPADAVNFGVEQARGRAVAIVVDGARMMTPGVVAHTLQALDSGPGTVVALPGYHLGHQLQQRSEGHDENTDRQLLEQIGWPKDGYRLFEVGCFSGSSKGGFFRPLAEANWLALSKRTYQQLGGCDERFDLPGGGLVNLDLYRRVCDAEGTRLVVLLGEGCFHQFHGGVTTGGTSWEERKVLLERANEQYAEIRGERWQPPRAVPTYFGHVPDTALRFVHQSSARGGGASKANG